VVADHKSAKQRKIRKLEEAEAGTFAALVRRYAEEHGRKNLRKWRYTARQLGLHYPLEGGDPVETKGGLVQRWADKQVKDIDSDDIEIVVDEARHDGCPGIVARVSGPSEARARDLHTALSSFFGWLCAQPRRHRLIKINPAAGALRPQNASARDRVLTPDEMVRFWRSCDKISVPFGAVFQLLLLTGCRLNEIARMRWDELRNDTLHLPATRTKNKRPHVVPLSPLALQILASVPRIENCAFVFSARGRKPISGWNKVKHQLDGEMGNPPAWVLHDLRRSAVTGMAELGIRPDVIELCINHIGGHRAGVAGIYNRSELLPERRDALLRWSQHVQGLVSGKPANVVRLRRK
jgi:integrase